MSLIEILTAVVLILVAVLCIALIYYLGKITSSFRQVQNDLSNLSVKFAPLISSLSELSDKLSGLSSEVISQLNVSKSIMNNVKKHVQEILDLEEKIRMGIEDPVGKILNNLKAISNGISTFFSHLKK